MDRETRPLAEMDDEQIRKVRMVVFDIDGVIIPKGTDLHENMDGTEFSMKTHKLSPKFVDDVVELKKHVRVAFSSGRNLLYLRSLVNHFFDNRIILQTENGAISFLDGKITHPDYPQEYFEAIHKIKVLVNKNSKEITLRGFEPKMFNLTVHAEVEKDLIYDLVRQSDPTGLVYCIWTGEAFDLGLKGITKGWRLEQTAKQLGMKRDEIVTTGNALNDKEMLEFGVGVTVEPGVVWGAYKTSGKGLGGEELADFLVKRFKELR